MSQSKRSDEWKANMITSHEGMSYVTSDGVKVKTWTAEEKEHFELGLKECGWGIGWASQSTFLPGTISVQ